jgi:hypothetical protein
VKVKKTHEEFARYTWNSSTAIATKAENGKKIGKIGNPAVRHAEPCNAGEGGLDCAGEALSLHSEAWPEHSAKAGSEGIAMVSL